MFKEVAVERELKKIEMMEPKWLWLSVMLLLLEGCRWCSTDACREDERIALLQLKPFFNNRYNCLNSWVEEVKGSDCCQWKGVECKTSSSRRVIGLSLNYTRSFKDQIWYLNASLFLPFKELKRLYLPLNNIAGCVENEDFAKLSLALGNLEILDLSDNFLNDTILSSLSQLSSLKHLYLGGNSFTGSSHANGFQLLFRLSSLETLDLSWNSLKNGILFQMGNLSSLKTLNLRSNSLEGTVYIHELNSLNNLKHLDLSYNRIESLRPSSQGNKTQLRSNNLEVLDLSGNLFRNNTFSFPRELSSLKSLSLQSNDFQGSIDITELNDLTNLKMLDLSSNNIESLQSFKGNETQLRSTNLEELDLSGNLFRNNTFSFPRGLSGLKSLSLQSNDLQGSIDITELNSFSNLKHLDLSFNRIESLRPSNQGNETQLKSNNLEVLDLSGNLFRNNTFSFLRGLSSLKSLSMYDNDLQGSIDITELNDLINLKMLDLSSNNIESLQSFKDSGIQLNLTHLEELDLSGNLINDNIFASLRAFPNLKSLLLSSNQLKGAIDMKDLGVFTNLEELYMSYNDPNEFEVRKEFHVRSNVGNQNLLQSVGVLTSLKILSLCNFGLTGSLPNQGWCDLRNLEEFDISENALEGILPYCFDNLTSLRMLDISDNQFTGNLTPLANLTSLRFVSLSKNHFEISMSLLPLRNFPKLKILLGDENKMVMEPNSFHTSIPKFQLNFISLSKCTTNQELSLERFKFLYSQYDLRYVDLSYNNFSGTVPFWLLENNTKLEDIFLMGNSFVGPLLPPKLFYPNAYTIDLSNNKLQGQIPTNICSTFPNLELLFLANNAFEGNIPSCLGGMSDLFFLDLSSNNLSGKVPEELILRSSLGIVRLSNNNLSGKIFPVIFNSSTLSALYLDGNNFVGQILDFDVFTVNFSRSLLEDLDLSNNYLCGKLPRWIVNASSLRSLALSNNQIEGSIPLELCNLFWLEFLDLSQNNLSGSMPSCFNSPHIRHLHLNGNKLSGPLALTFNNSFIVTLDLRENSLTGNIPKWIGTLSTLSVLLLKANHLDGGIPVQLCKLYSLSIIDLSENMFSGHIPSCLGNLTLATKMGKSYIVNYYIGATIKEDVSFGENELRLSYPGNYMEEWIEFTTKSLTYSYGGDILEYMSGIDLSCNNLTGQIPSELGNLSGIRALNLSHNNLIGVIPSSFSKLKQIESLDLSYNNLSGKIPAQLVELNSLEVFSVAHNNLSGSTPETKAQFGTFDESSYEGNHFLCGPPLHKNCSETKSPSIGPTKADDEGEGSFIDQFVFCVTFMVSYVIVLLGNFVVLYINPYWRQTWFSFIEGCINTCRYSIVGDFLELYVFRRCA